MGGGRTTAPRRHKKLEGDAIATAAEKQAKQDVKDLARQTIGQGAQRLQSEVPKAGSAFPVRRLRAAGDLSRYTIGGFSDDPFAKALESKYQSVGGTTGRQAAQRASGAAQAKASGSGAGKAGGSRTISPKFGLSQQEVDYIERSQKPGPSGARRTGATGTNAGRLAVPTKFGLSAKENSYIQSRTGTKRTSGTPAARAKAARAAAAAKARTRAKAGSKRAAIQSRKTAPRKAASTTSRQRAY